ncbi:hypothetical protein I5907_18360 [Panacibacter sp. DH6]|uniref:Uncharacterized protein n=1 Tax=Panacibacter microcysteis TaxID=2793269 RepID=A0A931GZH5_9BACT|nr:hypothetical protein [Panacibacter microcysteis]MBG9378208.1 hypothetical protein [Panacibacter microcysteis]
MKSYTSKSGKDSGVTGYETGRDYIIVAFGDNHYIYSYGSAGKLVVEKMKSLALASAGLSSFIARHNPGYEKKY